MNSLTLQSLDNLPDINPGDNLAEIIFKSITETNTKVLEGTIFVIAQKIILKQIKYMLSLYPSKTWYIFNSRRTSKQMNDQLAFLANENNNVLIVL